jgi:hypothetical protein
MRRAAARHAYTWVQQETNLARLQASEYDRWDLP